MDGLRSGEQTVVAVLGWAGCSNGWRATSEASLRTWVGGICASWAQERRRLWLDAFWSPAQWRGLVSTVWRCTLPIWSRLLPRVSSGAARTSPLGHLPPTANRQPLVREAAQIIGRYRRFQPSFPGRRAGISTRILHGILAQVNRFILPRLISVREINPSPNGRRTGHAHVRI